MGQRKLYFTEEDFDFQKSQSQRVGTKRKRKFADPELEWGIQEFHRLITKERNPDVADACEAWVRDQADAELYES